MILRIPEAANATDTLKTIRGGVMPYVKPKAKRSRDPNKITAETLAFQMRAAGLPVFKREWMFAKDSDKRNWRFDFAWPELRLAVEFEGLVVKRIGKQLVCLGRHMTIDGYSEDRRKYAVAAIRRWTVLQFNQALVKNGEALAFITRAIEDRRGAT